jgi:hypothetical protein
MPPRYTDDEIDSEVLRRIRQHVGASNPIGRWELVARIYGPVAAGDQNDGNPADRQIRESVARLRRKGVLICDMGDGAGRYLAASVDEYQAFKNKYGSRAYEVLETLREMDKEASRQWPTVKQPRLI